MEEKKLSHINCPMGCLKTGAVNDSGVFSFYCENNNCECHFKDNPQELVGLLELMNEFVSESQINS